MNLRKKFFFTLVSLSCIFTISIVSCHQRCRNCTLKPSAVPTVPTVTNASPTGTVSLTTSDIILTFSEAMNPTTISSATVSLFTNTSTTNIIAACTPASGNIVFECSFNTSLISNARYTLTVSTGAQSSSAVSLAADYVANFATLPRFAYVTNTNGNTVALCPVNSNGTFGTCINSGGTTFNSPGTIVINPARTFAYVTNYSGNNVSVCTLNAANGTLSGCVTTNPSGFSRPVGIALNTAGTLAYVTDYNGGDVSICTISPTDGTFVSCPTSDPDSTFDHPDSIVLNASSTFLYVTNANQTVLTENVSTCSINTDGSLGTCTASNPGSTFFGPAGIALNSAETFIYVVNGSTNINAKTVSMCPVNLDGSLGTCTSLYSYTFNDNNFGKIALNVANTFAYVVNENMGWVSLCPVNADGTFGTCTVLVDPAFVSNPGNFVGPQGIALL